MDQLFGKWIKNTSWDYQEQVTNIDLGKPAHKKLWEQIVSVSADQRVMLIWKLVFS